MQGPPASGPSAAWEDPWAFALGHTPREAELARLQLQSQSGEPTASGVPSALPSDIASKGVPSLATKNASSQAAATNGRQQPAWHGARSLSRGCWDNPWGHLGPGVTAAGAAKAKERIMAQTGRRMANHSNRRRRRGQHRTAGNQHHQRRKPRRR